MLPILYIRIHTRAGCRTMVLFKWRFHSPLLYHEFPFPRMVGKIFLVVHGGHFWDPALLRVLAFTSQSQAFANPGLLPLCQNWNPNFQSLHTCPRRIYIISYIHSALLGFSGIHSVTSLDFSSCFISGTWGFPYLFLELDSFPVPLSNTFHICVYVS